jgi:hypothetical protein
MSKRKRTKGQTTIYKTLQRKLKIDQRETILKSWGEFRCSGRVCSSWLLNYMSFQSIVWPWVFLMNVITETHLVYWNKYLYFLFYGNISIINPVTSHERRKGPDCNYDLKLNRPVLNLYVYSFFSILELPLTTITTSTGTY